MGKPPGTQRTAIGGDAADREHDRHVSGDQRILDEHQERFREVFEEAAIGMATMTLTGHLVRTNRALAALCSGHPQTSSAASTAT